MKVRKEILDAAEEMERMMQKHDPKKGDSWKTINEIFLDEKLLEELMEYLMLKYSPAFILEATKEKIDDLMDKRIYDEVTKQEKMGELVDVAIVATMLWNRVGGIHGM